MFLARIKVEVNNVKIDITVESVCKPVVPVPQDFCFKGTTLIMSLDLI